MAYGMIPFAALFSAVPHPPPHPPGQHPPGQKKKKHRK